MKTLRVIFLKTLLLIAPAAFLIGSGEVKALENPDFYSRVAEDISATTWARCRFRIEKPPESCSLAFFTYNYHENKSPLIIRINGSEIRYVSDQGHGSFTWHTVTVSPRCLVSGINEVQFSAETPATNTWAVAIEYAAQPAGSSKSTNQGESWYSASLGYNYSVVGNYAVRILDRSGSIVPINPVADVPLPAQPERNTPQKTPGMAPEQTIGGRYEPFTASFHFSGDSLFECMRDGGIEMDGKSGGARLRRGEIIKNEDGNAQLNIDRSRFENTDPLNTPWWLGEQVTDTVWIKKELDIGTTETETAHLMLYYQINPHAPRKGSYLQAAGGSRVPLSITVNGRSLDPIMPDTGWRNRTEDWRLVEFPKSILKTGFNEIVLRTGKGGDWRFAYENTTASNHSARSTDSGRTWDYNRIGENGNDNGEYLIRFYLDRFHRQGMVWSLPVSLGVEKGNAFLRRLKNSAVTLTADGDFPAGTTIQMQARFGTGIIPDDESWTAWSQPSAGKTLTIKPPDDRHRYLQWRAVLATNSRLVTTVLTSVRVEISGSREVFSDEAAIAVTAINNPPLKLNSLTHHYDSSENLILKTLREQYPLDDIMSQDVTEYEKLLRLASWVHEFRYFAREKGRQHLERYGIDRRVTHWAPNNALWSLNMFSRGYGHLDRMYGAHCHDYNLAFVGCLKALGFVARPLIMTRLIPPEGGHSFPEVWSNEFNKWIYVDPYRAQFYIRDDGIPVNTMELHEAQFDSTLFNRISTIRLDRLFASPEEREKDKRPGREECPRGYESFGIWLRDNLMDEPAPYHIWDGVMSFRWDGRIWFQDSRVRFIPEFSRYTQREDDLYWSVNQCFLQPFYCGKGTVYVAVSHTMPNMKSIEYRLDDETPWKSTPGTIIWTLHDGANTVHVRAVNDFGRAGAESAMTIVKKK